MTTKILKCRDCLKEFVFTESEQRYYAERNFRDPLSCPDCRKKRKESKQSKQELAALLRHYVEEHDAAAREKNPSFECGCEPCQKAHPLLARLNGRQNQPSSVR